MRKCIHFSNKILKRGLAPLDCINQLTNTWMNTSYNFFFLNYRNLHVYTRVFKHINRVFKSGFSGRLACDNRKFRGNRSFPNPIKVKQVDKFQYNSH